MIQDSLQKNGHFPLDPTQYIPVSLLLEVLRANDLFYPESSKSNCLVLPLNSQNP